MTNREIHEMAAPAYERFSAKSHRIGYSVRWETGEWKFTHPEHDVAGFMSKQDALRIGRAIVKDGRRGVHVYGTIHIDSPGATSFDACAILSEDSPELSKVAQSAVGNEITTMRKNGEQPVMRTAIENAARNANIYAVDAGMKTLADADALTRYLKARINWNWLEYPSVARA